MSLGNFTTNICSSNWDLGNKRKVQLETIKIILSCFFLSGSLLSQQYSISIFGLHAADVNLIRDSTGTEFKTNNRGLFDLIWPTSNMYRTSFDREDLSIKNWDKTIKQGSYETTLSGGLNSDGHMEYKDKEIVKIKSGTHTIFTMIELVSKRDKDFLDTKWFHYEHEGSLGRARFIWADSSNQWNGQDSIFCDHYRFDIDIIDSTQYIRTNDYFMDTIINPSCIRELWVSKTDPKRIILAKISIKGIPVLARIQIDKET